MGKATIAVLGLGEAGREIAADLATRGFVVTAFDPLAVTTPPGLSRMASEAEAARGADLVLSVNGPAVADSVATNTAPVLEVGQVYADLNTASPKTKEGLARIIAPSGAAFADVALLAPVAGRGVLTPALVSGPGAEVFARTLIGAGMPVTVLDGPPGAAAARKLVRSIAMKGFAAAVIEALAAAEALGLDEWLQTELVQVFADPALVGRFVSGTPKHAVRRTHEMLAARELLEESGIKPYVTDGVLQRLAEFTNVPAPEPGRSR